jgi:transcriptional regulator with XRE-family HTH domain
MPRPSSREKDVASLALIKMRAKFGWTQTQLAANLGVAVQTVGRWESYDPPRGAALERLAVWAEEAGYSGADDFRYAQEAQHGLRRPLWFGVETEEESQTVIAVLDVLRRPQWAHLLPQLKRDLQPVFDAWAKSFSEQRRLIEAISTPIPKPKRKKKS